MSVEDPRLSNISEENLTENFSSEIQEEIASSSSTPSPIEHEIQVAQAGDGRTPTTGRVPTDPNAPAAPPAAPAAEVTPDANNIIHLAANVSIDDVRVDGANLILVQADGTEIVIVNGASKIPTMLIGEVEVPQQVLFAALEDSGINVAAGPDGSFSASGRPDSSGAEFEDSIQQNQNGPIQLASLLGDTEFGDGTGLDAETAADDQPIAVDMSTSFGLTESVLVDGIAGNETITGVLQFDGGDDFGIVTSVNFNNANDLNEGPTPTPGDTASLSSGGHPVTVTTSPDGLTVTGTITVGGVTSTVFAFQVTNAITGEFTFTQSQPLDHPDGNETSADDILRLNLSFTVTDKDGDASTGSFMIDIADDGPSISGSVTLVSVNEDDLSSGNDDGESHESLVSSAGLGISWGADANVKGESEGDTFGRSIAFNSDGLPQNLTSGGVAVVYGAPTVSANGTVTITAYKGNIEGPAVFTVTLDPTSEHGTATFELKGPLDHASESNSLPLTFNYTATDADGDSQTGNFSVTVDDDIPTIGENSLVQLDDDALEGGIEGGNGDDADSVNATGVLAHAYGADGAGSVLWLSNGLTLPEGFTATPSEDGKVMTIYQGERAVVSITITDTVTGAYQVTQLAPINHPQGTIPGTEDNVQFTVSYQATDKDGDAAATPGTLTINVDDDIPTIGANALVQLDDDALEGGIAGGNGDDADSVNATGVLAHAYGADGAGSVLWLSNGLTLPEGFTASPSEDGKVMTIYQGERAVVSITITDTVTGAYEVTQLAPINHPQGTIPGTEDNVQFTVSYQATDKDGDAAATPGTLTINVDDDIPTIGENALVQLDDDALEGGIEGGNGDDADSVNATGVLAHAYGADGAGSVLWLSNGLTLPEGFTATPSEDGKVMTIYQGERAVVSITITDTVTGAYQVTQLAPINHPQGTIPGTEDNVQFTVSYQATDKDGDAAATPGTLTINVDDDIPTIGANALVQLDDDALEGGIEGGNGDDADSVNATGVLAHAYGADGAGSVLWLSNGLTLPEGFTATPSEDGKVMTIYQGERAVVSITITDTVTGAYEVTQLAPINHPQGTIPGTEDNVQFTVSYQATDKDGDAAATPGTLTINVDDDIPTVGKPVQLNGVDEDDLPLGNDFSKEPRTSSAELGISWGADDAKVGDAGATTHRALSFSGLSSALAGLTSDGYALQVGPDGVTSLPNGGETVTIYNTHGDAVFKLTLDPTTEGGNAKFELLGNLDHRAGGEAVDQLTLNFGFTATDSDGDAVDGGFSIIVTDDAPIWLGAINSSVEEEELPGGNEDTSGSGDNDFTVFGGLVDLTQKSSFGSLGILWGADNNNPTPGAGLNDRSVVFGGIFEGAVASYGNDVALKSNGEDVKYHLADDGRTLIGYTGESFEGGTVVFTVTVSDDGFLGAGRYDFTLNATLDHPAGSNENKINLDFDFIAKDSDGDSVGGSFTVSVIDDTPVQGTVGTNAGLNEDDVSTYSATDATSADIVKTNAASLGISWGADNDVRGAGDTYGRTVGFSNSAGAIASAITTTDASTFGLSITGGALTSGGNALNYVLTSDVNGGQTLTAYIQGTETKVFQIVLDPTASKGSYTVEIFNELDHAEGSNSATLSFKFVGTDADGDHAAVGTATVTIADDQLVVGTPQSGDVDEDGWTQLASGAGNPGPLFGGGDSLLVDTVTTRNLNISWGADDANKNVNGGYVGAQVAGDRSVVFGTNSVPADLTSNGFKIVYEVGANGTELIAYRQQNGSYYDADGHAVDAAAKASAAVFKVSLSDVGSGSYTFTLLDNIDQARGNEENNTDLNFQFVARDADGDQVTKSFSVSIDDDTPVLGLFPSSSGVDEDDIGTAAGATTNSLNISWGADQGNSAVNAGSSNVDGDRYVVFDGNSAPNGLTSNGHAIRYETSLNGTMLTAYRYEDGHYVGANGENLGADKAGAAVFTVGLSDQGSGSYTFTLVDNLDHSGFQGGKITLGFDFTAVDGDGDDADGSFYVSIDDDTPSLTSVAASAVDEDGLLGGNAGESYPGATGTNADLAGASTTTGAVSLGVNWGADADIKSEYLGDNRDYDDDPIGREINFVRAGGQVVEISTGKISDNNVSSYLGSAFANLKSDGVSLDYRIDYLRDGSGNWNGGYVLTAYKDSTDPTVAANQVFKVTLDPTAANGSYKFDLLGNLDHSGTNAEDNLDLTFNFRATDSDGDSTGRGSFTVTIDDDAPIASVVTVAGNTLLGDETAGVDAGTDDMTGALPSAFSSLGTALGWSQQANMVSTAGNNYGADGAGSQSLALTKADGGVFNGENSGIQTLNGSDVKLYTEGNLVVGKVGATVVFALSIDGNGTVSMAQYQPIKHGDAANANETASVNGVYVTTTISDREGDTTHATTSTALDIKVRDDAPTVSPTQTGVTVDEDGLSSGNSAGPAYADDAASNSKTASANLSYNFGTDGLAGEATNIVFQTSNLASLGLKSFGTSLSYAWDNSTNTLTATAGNAGPVVFTLKVTDVATGAYTFTLERPLDHSTTSGANKEDDINIDFNFTIRDGDGDPASGIVRVTIDDDAPYIGSPEAETVSEVNLPYTLGDEANADSDSSTVQRGNLDIHWGADNRDANSGPDISVRFGANSAPSGLTSNGETIRYDVDGTTLTAYTGSGFGIRIIFTVSLDDNGSGQYTFKLYDNIDHTNADAASKTLSFNFIAEDSDNDEASGSFNVTIGDGGPSVGVVENETVNESALPNDIIDAIFADADGSSVQRGDLNITWGADDNNSGSFNRSVNFNAALNGADSGLTHDGTAIMYTLSPDGTVLTAKAGATTVFTVSLSDSGDGSYTFTLNDNIDHLGANGSSATLNFGFTAKDSDGDTAPGSFAVTIVDDTPEADTPSRQFLEEHSGSPAVSNVSLGIDWKSDDNNSGSANRSVAFANATPAANITNAAGQPITLTSNGQTLSYALLAGVLVAYVNGDPAIAANRVFEVSLNDNGSGSYTFTMHQPLDHGAPISNDDAYLDLRFLYTATDSDGDGDNASFTVRVDAAGNVTNNGNNISYDDLNSGVFVNLGDNSVTVNGQTVAGDTATDLTAVGDKVLGIDRMNGIVNVTGGDGNDILVGSSQANTIRGGDGNDTIIGNGGDDTLEGGAGDDLFIYKVGDGNDRINGGTETSATSPNYDVLRVEGDAQARTFNIGLASGGPAINTGSGNAADTADIAVSYNGPNSASIRADEIEGIDIVAGSGAITVNVGSLAGTAVLPNTIHVTGSNSATGDVVDASGITAANAVSVIFDGNDGNDSFIGGAGKDTARGGNGNDTLTGGLGADIIEAGAGSDTINLGADTTFAAGAVRSGVPLVGLTAIDVNIAGKAGTLDTINGGFDLGDTVYLKTGAQGFVLDGYQTNIVGVERIVGSDGDDLIIMRSDYVTDEVAGRTTIEGGIGNDTIVGGAGNDVLDGGQGVDTLAGGDGADILKGGAGDDKLWGGKAADSLFGNGTSNTGSDLNATIGEADSANYGGAADKYHVFFDTSVLGGGLGIWRVQALDGAPEFIGSNVSVDTDNLYGIEKIQFNNLTLDLLAPVRLFDGNNLVGTFTTITDANTAASAGFRIELVGTVTNQAATITKENLTVVGGAEDTGIVLTLNGVQNITLQGEAPIKVIGDGLNNTINGNDGANVLEGGDGNDVLNGNGGDDSLYGGAGNDRFGGGTGTNKMVGGTGNDQFFATGGTDTIYGNGEADIAATAGENDMVVYYGNQSNFAITRMLDGGWQVLNTVNGEIDKLYGVESINFNGGAIELDLTAPVQLFDGNNLVGTFATITDANTAASAGFRIELVGTVTNQSATITKENLTVVGGAEDTGIVLTLNGVQNITLQGEAPINVIGDGLNNTINGNDGANALDGGDGSDVLNGGGGNDTFVLGADVTGSGTRNIQLGDGSLLAVNIAGLAGTGDKVIGGTGSDTIILERDGKPGFVADYSTAPGYLSGVEKIVGTDGNDVILLAAGSTADGGPITIEGGEGNDVLGGSNSADIINGGDGNDLISGLGGNDILEGGAGSDEIWGGAGNDQINGGSGIDNITGGLGNDTIDGGIGGDTFNYAIGDGVDTIDGGTQGDVLLTSGNATAESAVLTVTSTGFTLDVDGDGIVDVNATNIESVVLYQADGADKITVRSQDSAETITIEGNSNLLQVYGNGIPSVSGISTSELTIEGKGGNDVINASGLNTAALPPVALTLDGGAGNDTITGSAGADTILGGEGNDTILYKVGAGADIIDGGAEDGLSNPDYDVLKIAGDAVQRSFNISKVTGGTEIVAGVDATDILVSYTGANGATLRADEIERIEVTLGSAGDSIAVGDLSGTAIAPTTVVINGGVGSDTIDLTGLVGTKVEINDIDDTTGGDTDTVKLAGKWADYVITRAFDGTFTFSLGGNVVATAKNIEQFTFQGENGGPVQAADLLNDAPHAGADSNAGDPVVEAGGVSNGTLGDPSAIGNVLTNDTDADVFDSKQVVAIQFGSGPATAVPAGNGDVTIAGTYGTLTIHSDGSYAYALDNNDGDTQALAQDAAASDVFTYTMADAHGLTSNANLTINITGTNDAPVVGAISDVTIAEDTVWSVTQSVIQDFLNSSVSDAEKPNSALEFKVIVNGVTVAAFNGANIPTSISYQPDPNLNGQLNASLEVFDGTDTTVRDFHVNVTPVADAPTLSVHDVVGNEDTTIVLSPITAGLTVGTETLSLSIAGIPVGAKLSDGTNTFTAVEGSTTANVTGWNLSTMTVVPPANDHHDFYLYVTATSTDGASTASTDKIISVTVNAVADAPTLVANDVTGNEDTAIAIPVTAALTVSSEYLSVSIAGIPVGAVLSDGTHSFTAASGLTTADVSGWNLANLTVKPPLNDNADFNLQVTATSSEEGTTASVHETLTVTVNSVNDAPTTANEVYFVNEDQELSGVNVLANDSDVDGDAISRVNIITANPYGPLEYASMTSNGTFFYRPIANEAGYSIINYTVSDGSLTSPATVTVNVRPIADTATISGSGSGNEDASAAIGLNIAVGDTDGSEKVTRIELSGFPAGATFNQGALEGGVWVIANTAGVNTTGLTMTPPHDFAGNFNLGVSATVVDSATLSDLAVHTDTKVSTGSIGVSITPVNDAAVLTPVTVNLTETNAVLTTGGTLTISDVDSSATFVAQTNAAGSNGYGKFTVNVDGTWTYATNTAHDEFVAGQTYTDSITVSSADGSTTTITVNIAGTSDTPTYSVIADINGNGQNDAITILASELTGNTSSSVKITAISNVSSLDLDNGDISADGKSVEIKDTGNTNGGSFTYQLSDGSTGTVSVVRGSTITTSDNGNYVLIGRDGANNSMTGGNGDNTFIGGTSADTIVTGNGVNTVHGGGGNDAITTGNGTNTITGGSGNDRFTLGTGTNTITDLGNSDILVAAGTTVATASSDWSASSSSSSRSSNDGSATIIAAGHDISVANAVGANGWTLTNDGNSTVVSLTGSSKADIITGGSGNDTLSGGSGNDTITGGGGNDTITGGGGGDTLTGGTGSDTFVIAAGDSTPQIGGTLNDGTITGYDRITDWGTGGTADKLDFSVPVKQANLFITNGVDSTLAIGGDTVELHTVNYQTGIATFYGTDDLSTYQNYPPLSINSTQALAAVVQYLMATNIGEAGATLAFNAMGNGYVYQQTGSGAGGTLVELTGAPLTDIYTTPFSPNGVVSSIDPIILDLDHNGFTFTSVEDGVKFDIDADGHKDQVAWTKTDGILAYDVDGNGKIDNGSEIFTPNFGGGTHAGGVAALSTLDVNHDGKIDASDTGFDKLLVWQDANGNGISDAGELKGLHDYGITGISLDAHSAEGYIDGQALFAEGTFNYADGSTGSFVEVGFDTLFSDAPDHVLVGTDGDDILTALPGMTQMTGGAGADTFVLDPSALHELDMADVITDYKSNEGDAVDVSKLLDTLLGHQATGEEAAANVRTTIAGNDTTVSVQVATDSWKDVAVLQNHTEAVKILFDDDKHAANISHV